MLPAQPRCLWLALLRLASNVDLLLAALATWRLTHLFLYENGPFKLLRRTREALGVRYYDEDSNDVLSAEYEITTCPWCLSMWVGGCIAALLLYSPKMLRAFSLPYALSAITVFIQRLLQGNHGK